MLHSGPTDSSILQSADVTLCCPLAAKNKYYIINKQLLHSDVQSLKFLFKMPFFN